jgi:hypothetical protein
MTHHNENPKVPSLCRNKMALRARVLNALPRIGTSPVEGPQELVFRVEEIAFSLGELLAERIADHDPNWGRLADALDDVLDVLDAVRKIPASLSASSAESQG